MKFTYYTIIGRDLNLLKGHVDNIKNYAGFNKLPCEKEFIVIIYTNNRISKEVTNSLVNYCKSENITPVLYNEPVDSFIHNLYACWNLGYEKSDEGYVFRGGSDQVFNKDSFIKLYEEAENLRKNYPDKKFVLQANTIENAATLNEIGAASRHFTLDIGTTFDTFNYEYFENFIKIINNNINNSLLTIQEALFFWKKPTTLGTSLGQINRADGCSWLMTKKEWEKFGPIPTIINGITGDVLIHDIMQLDGYEQFIVKDCVTYHFVRGESKGVTQ